MCIGLDYADHARETKAEIQGEPVILQGRDGARRPDDDLPLPRGSVKTDWEVELAVVIGHRARYVSREDALRHVAGYALHNDYSERQDQIERGGQWSKGKSHDGYAPLGPFLATRDEIADTQSLPMWLTVNGESRQKSSTKEMIFGVSDLVFLTPSQFMTLLPGDVISTDPGRRRPGHGPAHVPEARRRRRARHRGPRHPTAAHLGGGQVLNSRISVTKGSNGCDASAS